MLKRLAVPTLALIAFFIAAPGAAKTGVDRDHDKLPDRWEKRYRLSTKQKSGKRDPDRDRLSNRREYRARTNPRRADTDRDGLNDYAELVRRKTNPRRADTDGDGSSDGAEVRAGTNPRSRGDHPPTPGAPGHPRPPARGPLPPDRRRHRRPVRRRPPT